MDIDQHVFRISGYFGGRLVVEPMNRAATYPTGMALFSLPQQNEPEHCGPLRDADAVYGKTLRQTKDRPMANDTTPQGAATPSSDVLAKALLVLFTEAKKVADDHHVPRYARLDDALASAEAVLARWGEPQAVGQPLQQSEPAAAITALWESIGHQCAQVAETGNKAPSQKLLDAMAAVGRLQQSEPARVPLDSVVAMSVVLHADQTLPFMRGTTNWACAIARAVERAHGITSKAEGAQP